MSQTTDRAGAGAPSGSVPASSQYDPVEAAIWLAAIVENSDDAILSKNLDGIILSWNPGATAVFGYSAEEAIGQPITIIIPDDRLDEEATIIGKIRRGEKVRHFETVRRRKDGSPIDISLTVSPVRDATGTIIGASKIARDISDARAAVERQSLILREMSHRIKNLFALTTGIVSLSARGASNVAQLVADFSERMASLARAHHFTLADLRDAEDPGARTLTSLLHAILAPYEEASCPRVHIEGCDSPIGGQALPSLALLFHELATNAAKYGALASDGGRLSIRTDVADGVLALRWVEHVQTEQNAPDREGFGTQIEKAALRGLRGTIERTWRSTGVTIHIGLPLDRLAE